MSFALCICLLCGTRHVCEIRMPRAATKSNSCKISKSYILTPPIPITFDVMKVSAILRWTYSSSLVTASPPTFELLHYILWTVVTNYQFSWSVQSRIPVPTNRRFSVWIMKENTIATNFEPHDCAIFVQSTKIGTHENKAIPQYVGGTELDRQTEGWIDRQTIRLLTYNACSGPFGLLFVCIWKLDFASICM